MNDQPTEEDLPLRGPFHLPGKCVYIAQNDQRAWVMGAGAKLVPCSLEVVDEVASYPQPDDFPLFGPLHWRGETLYFSPFQRRAWIVGPNLSMDRCKFEHIKDVQDAAVGPKRHDYPLIGPKIWRGEAIFVSRDQKRAWAADANARLVLRPIEVAKGALNASQGPPSRQYPLDGPQVFGEIVAYIDADDTPWSLEPNGSMVRRSKLDLLRAIMTPRQRARDLAFELALSDASDRGEAVLKDDGFFETTINRREFAELMEKNVPGVWDGVNDKVESLRKYPLAMKLLKWSAKGRK